MQLSVSFSTYIPTRIKDGRDYHKSPVHQWALPSIHSRCQISPRNMDWRTDHLGSKEEQR